MTTVLCLYGPGSYGELDIYYEGFSSYALNDANDAAALVLQIPKDGTVTQVGFNTPIRYTGVNWYDPSYYYGLTTIGTDGNPTQTAYGGGSLDQFVFVSSGWNWYTLTTPATVIQGNFAAIHIFPSGLPVPTLSGHVYIAVDSLDFTAGFPTVVNYSTFWSRNYASSTFAIKYNDNSIYGWPVNDGIGVTIASNTTPDEIGDKFTIPFDATCIGVRVTVGDCTNCDQNTVFEINLYNSGGTSLGTISVPNGNYTGLFNDSLDLYFDSPIDLTADTIYRVTIKVTSSSPDELIIGGLTFLTVADKNGATIPEISRWSRTERTDGGAWTDTDTDYIPFALWLNDITTSGVGNGSTPTVSGVSQWGFVG